MTPLDKALEQIGDIRAQLAEGALFRGFGPAVVAGTGGAALLTAAAQSLRPDLLAASAETFLAGWIVTAALCAAVAAAEMVARSRRLHGGMADAMLLNAVESFLPAGLGGAAVAAVLLRFAPEALWTLPGLWQIFFALGLFAAARMLPRPIRLVAAWYFVSGVAVLILCARDGAAGPWTPNPWMMGAPFAIGQLAMAATLRFAGEGLPGQGRRHD